MIEQSPTPLATEPWAHGEEVSEVPDGRVATITTAKLSEETSERPSVSRSRKDARSSERSAYRSAVRSTGMMLDAGCEATMYGLAGA